MCGAAIANGGCSAVFYIGFVGFLVGSMSIFSRYDNIFGCLPGKREGLNALCQKIVIEFGAFL